MGSPKVLFLEVSGGGGHLSITTSIIQALKKANPDIQTVRVDIIPHLAHKLYQMASRQFVNALMIFYKATQNPHGEIFASSLNSVIIRKKLTKIIADTKPDLVFSNCLAVRDIPKILEEMKKPIPFIVFVPDPFNVHGIYLSKKATLTLAATLDAYQTALRKGIPARRLRITGHPVREEFGRRPADIREHRRKLGLDPDMFTILFGGSGHGAEKTLEILLYLGAKPSVSLAKRLIRSANFDYKTYYKLFFKNAKEQPEDLPPFQALCVCGDNIELKKTLEMLMFPSYIKPFIYTNSVDIAPLMHASNLVVAKAGPNILFESVMAGKPFLASNHLKGHEDGNIDFIRSTQLGFVEENPQKAASLIGSILKNKQLLEYTRPGLDEVYLKHKDAPANIAGQIIKLLK